MSAISPQTIANELSDKILAYDSESMGAEFELAQIRRGILKLKKVNAASAFLLEGFYYTYCEPSKNEAISAIEKGLMINRASPTLLANAGTIYRAWGNLDLSCEFYADAFVNGNMTSVLDTLVRQSYIAASLDSLYIRLESMLKNVDKSILDSFLSVYNKFNQTSKEDLLFFKEKVLKVLVEFKKDIFGIGIVDMDDASSFVNISVNSKSVDEVFSMNSMLEDLVVDSLEKSPSRLTVNYSFIVKQ